MKRLLENFQTKPNDSDFPKNFFGKELAEIRRLPSIVIFGAGNATQQIVPIISSIFKIKLNIILDNSAHFKPEIMGIKVLTPEEFHFNASQYFVICTAKNHEEIQNQLFANKIKPENIHIPEIAHLTFYSHIMQWYLDDQFIEDNIERIEKCYELLNDRHSQRLLLHRLGLFSKCPDYRNYRKFVKTFSRVPEDTTLLDNTTPETYLYFNNTRIKNIGNIFIDVGSYHGESIYHFIKKNNNSFEKILALEPDMLNFEVLKKRYGLDARISLFNSAAWGELREIYFESTGSDRSHTVSNDQIYSATGSQTGLIKVEAVPIDQLEINDQIGIVQIDVEGSEGQVISGMHQTLNNNNLELIVAAYHNKFDIIDLVLQISSICSKYKFALELLSDNLTEINIFASLK